MDCLNLKRKVFRALARWYVCVLLLLLMQLTVALLGSNFGTRGGGLEHFLNHAYLTPAYRLGETFFAEPDVMSLGNAPLGLGLLLLVVILYASLGGTIVYLIYWISSTLSRGKE